MFKKIFEYAGPYKKNMYVATVVVLVSVLMGVLPFVLAYQEVTGGALTTEVNLLKHPLSFCAWFLSWRVWCCKPFSMAGD